ncbi:copper chaperone CopZ [Lysinibacillus sphaericus]|uniref:Copper chaperone CopZ n=1 Tax=Lysinibacillus sphaericus OT4b.31 TaxID=1285586 RepID=R7ZKJ3_LYSSH|nr:copper chaperone CopZ [Lysinibacillus sphaericus]EON74605.1 copper chaperone copper-ion-binding protein CopZ [Lysinibacillus sphaericus OT4b.31]
MQNVTLNVQGMSCGHCVSSVEKSVGALTGVDQVKVNLTDGLVDVAFNEAQVTLEQIKETIDDQGYEVK